MRALSRRLASALIVATCLAAATSAHGSLVTLVGGSLTIGIGPLPAVSFPQSVSALPILVSSGGGSFTEPASVFSGHAALPTALFTGVPLINGFHLGSPLNPIANGAKLIAGGAAGGGHASGIQRVGGGLGGPGPLFGTAVATLLGLINVAVPLSPIGNTGASTVVSAPGGQFTVTIFGTGWTTGAVTLTGVTTGGVNTVTFAGYDNRDPAHNGVLQLVSPFKVMTNVMGNLPSVATQTLIFVGGVPEPGTLGLLATGAAGLALLGWRRRR